MTWNADTDEYPRVRPRGYSPAHRRKFGDGGLLSVIVVLGVLCVFSGVGLFEYWDRQLWWDRSLIVFCISALLELCAVTGYANRVSTRTAREHALTTITQMFPNADADKLNQILGREGE